MCQQKTKLKSLKKELDILRNFLKTKNIDSEIVQVLPNNNFNCLEWESQYGWRNRVYNGTILIVNNSIRAYQEERLNHSNDEEYRYSLVIVKEAKQEFKWNLVQIDRDENRFECLYLAEHNKSIIHIHKHALHTTILSYKDEILKRFYSGSELINRKGDIISIERVQRRNRDKPIELIQLPDLNKIKSITYMKSDELNLRPTGNFPIGYLNKE